MCPQFQLGQEIYMFHVQHVSSDDVRTLAFLPAWSLHVLCTVFVRWRVPLRRQSRQILSIVRCDNSSGANSRTVRYCPLDDGAPRCATPGLSTNVYSSVYWSVLAMFYKYLEHTQVNSKWKLNKWRQYIYCLYICRCSLAPASNSWLYFDSWPFILSQQIKIAVSVMLLSRI